MKKFISMMIVAVLLVSSLSVSAFAATINVEGNTSHDIYAKYVEGNQTDTYKVVIGWGDMKFTYHTANETWNTTTHTWDKTGGGWSVNTDGGNQITITNHSSKDIKAGLDFAATRDGVGVGTFTQNNKTVTEVTVGNALSGTAQTETVTFMPTGTLGSDMTTEGKIGSIAITLS